LRGFLREWALGKFNVYKIDLKSLAPGKHEFKYFLENTFFTDIDGDEVRKGKVNVCVTVQKLSQMFEMNFDINGVAIVPCDRCLDDMEIPVESHNRLMVKFGKEYSEESDEIVVIPEEEGAINIAWFLYEFIALDVPMKHVHEPGKCNKTMTAKLRKHTARSYDDETDDGASDDEVSDSSDFSSEPSTDPRWDALRDFEENDNN